MWKRGFKLFASTALGWSCAADRQACPGCGEAAGSESQSDLSSASGGVRAAFCGDGIWDPDHEQCDDGSACRDGRECTNDRLRCQSSSASACQPRSRDGCSELCTLEPGFVCRDGRDCHEVSRASVAIPSEVQSPLASPDAGLPLAGGAADPELDPPSPAPRAGRCRRPSFAAPELLTGLGFNLELWSPSLAADNRTLFFSASAPGTVEHIYFATRNGRSSSFSPPTLLANVNSDKGDGTPMLSADGLSLYFYSTRPGGSGARDLWWSTRPSSALDFAAPSPLGELNSPGIEHLPWVSADELTLLYVSTRDGGLGQPDVWLSKRVARSQDFGAPQLFSAIDSSLNEGRAVASGDGELVLFSSSREGGQGGQDLWLVTRDGNEGEFNLPINLSALNSPNSDLDPFLALDQRELFFSSNRSGHTQIWRSLVECDD